MDDEGGDDEGDDDHDDDHDGEDDHDGDKDGGDDAGAAGPMFSKKNASKKSGKKSGKKSAKKSSKKSSKKSGKKMHKEGTEQRPSNQWWRQNDAEWMKSVQGMLGVKADTKHRDGWSEYQEDSLLAAANPNSGSEGEVAPLPGQPGFAPSGRLDMGFDSSMSLGEAVKVLEEACGNAGPKLQRKLIKKLAQLHNKLI
jgi:hypothetical protein